MKIILLGYMASGKSTIGKFLATKMYLPFIDLDAYIETKEKKTISEIFKDEGEIYFRLKEHQYLKKLLAKEDHFILSLGGGTPCYARNMEFISQDNNSKSVYLKASIKTIVNRLQRSKNKRPLIANLNNEKLYEFVAKHLFERSYFYNKATIKMNVDNKSIEEITNELLFLLTEFRK